MNNQLFNLWKEANTPLEYIIVAYIWFLFGIATISWFSLFLLFLTEPERMRNISFGIFDYL